MSVKTEKELIALAKAGDERSFELLIEQCKTKAYNIALRYLRNEEDAMDALQESFIKIYRHLGSFKEGSKFDTWVYRIVVNTCNDMLRKNHGAPVESLNRSDEEEEEYTLELPDPDPGPQESLLRKEQAKLILQENIDRLHFVAEYLMKNEIMEEEQFVRAMSEPDITLEDLEAMVAEKRRRSREENEAHARRIAELEKQREEIKLSIMTEELQKPKLTKEQIIAWIEQFRYGDKESVEYQKRVIDSFVNAVYVFDDKLVLTYNFKGGTQTIGLEDIEEAFGSDLTGGAPPEVPKP